MKIQGKHNQLKEEMSGRYQENKVDTSAHSVIVCKPQKGIPTKINHP